MHLVDGDKSRLACVLFPRWRCPVSAPRARGARGCVSCVLPVARRACGGVMTRSRIVPEHALPEATSEMTLPETTLPETTLPVGGVSADGTAAVPVVPRSPFARRRRVVLAVALACAL